MRVVQPNTASEVGHVHVFASQRHVVFVAEQTLKSWKSVFFHLCSTVVVFPANIFNISPTTFNILICKLSFVIKLTDSLWNKNQGLEILEVRN
jgi:hypothetical protein